MGQQEKEGYVIVGGGWLEALMEGKKGGGE